ncbi:hypothetical protein [Actinomadura rugatobispora]|uniref:Uncharacterized protein n=1 Tax=Actinomadura rugatobispora TaxID=1994 RepID=A0ABW0ZQ91_9ACTN|nr:hypothetical protein GCM10010200_036190 [Actinomadura rugatobispora]
MERRTDICPGRENAPYVEAWNAYDVDHAAWLEACDKALQEAGLPLVVLPEGSDKRAALMAPLRLPEPPEAPDLPCTIGNPVWCSRCQANILRALRGLDDLASNLESWQDGHRGAHSGERVSRRTTGPASASPVADTLDQFYGELVDVEDEWRQQRGYEPRPRRARDGRARRLTLAFLISEAGDLLADPERVTFARRLLHWERLLHGLARSEPVVRRLPGRCPRCRFVNTLQTREDGYIRCRNEKCGRLLSEEEYEELVESPDAGLVAESRGERQAS